MCVSSFRKWDIELEVDGNCHSLVKLQRLLLSTLELLTIMLT
jgi:hypothetical protein